MATHSSVLAWRIQGQRSLVGCSPWGLEELDTTERLHFHFSLSCTGEGNGHPLQCSRLENPRDGGAWWAAVYGVTQSRTWLKRLSSSSSSCLEFKSQILLYKLERVMIEPLNMSKNAREDYSLRTHCDSTVREDYKWKKSWLNPAAAAKSLQSCPTLCDPIDGSPPGSPVPGILQAGTLERVAISFSRPNPRSY